MELTVVGVSLVLENDSTGGKANLTWYDDLKSQSVLGMSNEVERGREGLS